MNDRVRALEILRRARDLLADRLTDRILAAEEGLLDDARGDSYLGDIETIYDQFGMRLTHLNQMINNLPLETEMPVQAAEDFTAADDYVGTHGSDSVPADDAFSKHQVAITGPLIITPPALPAPMMDDQPERLAPSFQVFAAHIRSDRLADAGRTLSILFELSESRGMQCVQVFQRRWDEDEAFLLKAMQLRGEVLSSRYNSALMLLAECFGLVGIEAIGVLQTLRARFTHAIT